jgi:hypothetical protein
VGAVLGCAYSTALVHHSLGEGGSGPPTPLVQNDRKSEKSVFLGPKIIKNGQNRPKIAILRHFSHGFTPKHQKGPSQPTPKENISYFLRFIV